MPFMSSLIKAAFGILFASVLPASAQAEAYSDKWLFYMATRNDHPALILYNVGIGDVLGRLPETNCLIVSLALKDVGPEGFPSPAEGKMLFKLDDAIIPQIAAHKAHDLGRLTALGERKIYIAAGDGAADLGKELVKTAGSFGYSASFRIEPDTLVATYANLLSPTPDEKRLSSDEDVLRQLAGNGDLAYKVRRVDHWAYFPSRERADAFATWAIKNGFSDVELEALEDSSGEFVVRSSHEGTMIPGDITLITKKLDQKARELGGMYDGWETAVMR